jgi:hypothetical protein
MLAIEVDLWLPLNAKGPRHLLRARRNHDKSWFSGLLPFNTYLWTAASSGYTTGIDSNLVQ